MAMSAKSRLECSLLVVVVGVSICDAILGGTKQTRHAAWMLCKVMSRIGNFCGAVRGYFHNVMHTRSFYDCFISCCFSSTTPWHEICFDNVWPCYIQKIVCNFTLPVWHSPFQTEDGPTLRRNVLIQYDLFKFDVSCIFIILGVWYASFLQCRCTKSFRILRKHRSKDYSYSPPQRTWPKIWYIKFGWAEHYWLRIKDIFWGYSRRIKAHRIPYTSIDFYSFKVWSLQVVGFEELPDHLLLIGVPYPVELSATHLHTYYLVGQALGCNWFCLGQGSW